MAKYPKRQKVKRYRRSFYSREMRVKKGIGIACIPREFVRHELDAGALKEVVTDPALPVRGIGLVLPKDEAPSFAVREFLNLLNKAPESAR